MINREVVEQRLANMAKSLSELEPILQKETTKSSMILYCCMLQNVFFSSWLTMRSV